MPFIDVTHVAIRVSGHLRDAEAAYAGLFGLAVSWREPVPRDAPFDLSWEELDAAGVEPRIVMLHSGAFRLTISRTDDMPGHGPIEHVGLQVAPESLAAIAERVHASRLQAVAERPGELLDFIDWFGVEWELDTRSFANPRAIVEAKRARSNERA